MPQALIERSKRRLRDRKNGSSMFQIYHGAAELASLTGTAVHLSSETSIVLNILYTRKDGGACTNATSQGLDHRWRDWRRTPHSSTSVFLGTCMSSGWRVQRQTNFGDWDIKKIGKSPTKNMRVRLLTYWREVIAERGASRELLVGMQCWDKCCWT